jgi:phosphoribosylformylglycinamidine synthase
MIKIAVILFPGTNCEDETLRMVRDCGMEAELFRWNRDYEELRQFDGYIIAGGFSYEDRGRSGLVASFDPIMNVIREEADRGKVVLGICNGAQILIETGLVPGFDDQKLSMCLAWNKRVKDGQVHGDWVSRWTYMKMDIPRGRCAFNDFEEDIILRVPIAHGEGRFISNEEGLLEKLIENKQTVFRYCDEKGNFIDEYPVNPNGATHNLSAVCNEEGNVMAMMPHPERTIKALGEKYMNYIFASMKGWIESHPVNEEANVVERGKKKYEVVEMPQVQASLLVRLIITDNEEWTLDQTVKSIGFSKTGLKKQIWWGIETDSDDVEAVMKKIVESGELANLSKEHVDVKIGDDKLEQGTAFLIQQMDDMKSAAKTEYFQTHHPELKIKNIHRGILWTLEGVDENKAKEILDTFVLHNPHSMTISRMITK